MPNGTSRSGSAPSARFALIAIALLAAAAALSTIWLVHPWYEAGGNSNDASIYVLCAQSLLRGEGYSYLGLPFTLRPPGFSALIAPVIAVRGLDFHALNLFVAAWGVLSVALLAAFQRARVGLWLALALGALAWLNPTVQAFCNRVMSDVPAAALLFAGLLLERWAQRAPSRRRDLVLGLWIGLSAYVRWLNALLFVAVIAARIARRVAAGERGGWAKFAAQRLALVAAVPVLVMAGWWVRNAVQRDEAPTDQIFAHSYATALFREDPGDPDAGVLSLATAGERVGHNLAHIASMVGARLRSERTKPAFVALGAAVLVLALVTAARRRGAADFMLLGCLCACALPPQLQDRHVLPIFLLALPAAVDALAWMLARIAPARWIQAGLAVGVVTLAGFDFAPRKGWDKVERKHASFVTAARAIDERLPADAVVAMYVGWHMSVYLQRPVYNLAPSMRASGRVKSAEAVIDRYGINTVLRVGQDAEADEFDAYLFRNYGAGETSGPARIYRVRP